jgi:hypothetical protein
LSIAQKLGYVSVVETLRTVTTVSVTLVSEDKYKVVAPETMQEALDSDSDDDAGEGWENNVILYQSLTLTLLIHSERYYCAGGDDALAADHMGGYSYLHTDDFLLHDDSLPTDKVTNINTCC